MDDLEPSYNKGAMNRITALIIIDACKQLDIDAKLYEGYVGRFGGKPTYGVVTSVPYKAMAAVGHRMFNSEVIEDPDELKMEAVENGLSEEELEQDDDRFWVDEPVDLINVQIDGMGVKQILY